MNERTCGECTACCTILGITEIEKPPGAPCSHLAAGCSIYETRPASCHEFQCVWLHDGVQPSQTFRHMERPDKVGIMLDVAGPGASQPMLVAREVRNRALQEPAALAMLDRLAHRILIMLIHPDGRRSFKGPDRLIKQAQQFASRHLPLAR